VCQCDELSFVVDLQILSVLTIWLYSGSHLAVSWPRQG
jgi:hypothetical protein